jgi:hypothetical protein
MNAWLTVLTSAAIGALVSSAVTLIGQHLERRARRDELLFTKAIDLAAAQRDFTLSLAEKSGATATLIDPAINAETYFRWFKNLIDTGKLPPDADKGRPKPK